MVRLPRHVSAPTTALLLVVVVLVVAVVPGLFSGDGIDRGGLSWALTVAGVGALSVLLPPPRRWPGLVGHAVILIAAVVAFYVLVDALFGTLTSRSPMYAVAAAVGAAVAHTLVTLVTWAAVGRGRDQDAPRATA